MFTIDVKADIAGTVRMLEEVKAGLGDRAIASALNKTAAQGRTQMVRAITSEYRIAAADVRNAITLRRASAFGNRLVADVSGEARSRAFNLIRFVEKSTTLAAARRRAKIGTKAELYFQIRRAGGKKFHKGAFIGNQGRTVFERVGKSRLPIRPVFAIAVPQMFNAKKIRIPVQEFIAAKFPAVFEAEARYFLSTVGR